VLAGKAKFTAEEQAGYDLFRGKAQCTPVTVMAGLAKIPCSPILPPAISACLPI